MARPFHIILGSVPAGYIYSNLEDMTRWMKIQLGQGDVPEEYASLVEKSHKYALKENYYDGWERLGHNSLGHSRGTPNYSFRLVFSPDQGLGVCVLSNLNATATVDNLCNSIYSSYLGKEEVGQEVFQVAEAHGQDLISFLEMEIAPEVSIYVYGDKSVFQVKKYGYVTQLIPDQFINFYIGDNIGTDVIITSPANPGNNHHKETILAAVVHEMVHAYTWSINKDLPLFVDEGLACYFSGMMPEGPLGQSSEVPSLGDLKVEGLFAPLIFAEYDGYYFAPTFIEYLLEEYEKEKLIVYINSGDFEGTYGQGLDQTYQSWLEWLSSHPIYS